MIEKKSKKELITEIKEIIDQYTTKLTVRQVYYRLVAKLLIPNVMTSYQKIVRILRDARIDGQIPFSAIEDRTRRSLGGDDDEETPEQHFEGWLDAFKRCDTLFKLPRWKKQDKYVEVWSEKQALEGLFQEITNKHNVVLATCRGYPSWTFIYNRAKVLKRMDREVEILYFGDFDASGEDIFRFVKTTLRSFGVNATFTKVALSKKQIEEHSLPPMPAKRSDPRAASHIAIHGDIAVELDAFEPDVLQGLIDTSIKEHFNEDTYRDILAEQAEKRDKIKEMVEDEISS